MVNVRTSDNTRQDGAFGYTVAHEDKPTTTEFHSTKESGEYPFGGDVHTVRVAHHFVVVDVVNYDVVGSVSVVFKTTRGLSTTERSKETVVGSNKFALRPVSSLHLLSKVTDV